MKKKLFIIAMMLTFVMVGCSAEQEILPNTEQMITDEEETKETTQVLAEEEETTEIMQSLSEEESLSETEFSFADLSKLQFGFSSGAGAWGEEFTIEKDGYFTGQYHDSDMGSIGEGYENGTVYSSTYSGHFSELTKINEYTYEMKLIDIAYAEDVDTEEIWDGVRYIYTDAYCLGNNDTFSIYLPGTPLSCFSEEELIWLYAYNQSETELTMTVIVDETNAYGMYSYERMAPLEDARLTYAAYKESYDYYGEQLQEANSTMEMLECVTGQYKVSDMCLNYLWNLVRYNVEEDLYKEILEEQRNWIKEKEAKAEEAEKEWGGGSFAPVAYTDMLATLTMKRCEELIAYLEMTDDGADMHSH